MKENNLGGGGEGGRATRVRNQPLSFPNPEKARFDYIEDIGTLSNLPVGGTTGLCHQSSEAISSAAEWYATNRETAERPIIPALRRRFGLSPLEAIIAVREAARAAR